MRSAQPQRCDIAAEAGWSYWSVIPRIKPGSIKGIEAQLNGSDFQGAGRMAGDTLGTNIGTSAKKRVGLMSKGIVAPLLTAVAAVGVKDFISDSLGEARESQKVGALTTSIIKSTGGAAKVTAKDVDRLSSSISKKTGVDDEQIASGANLLLTFKNVKREGSGLSDIFGRATAAAADLSAAGFGDLSGQAKMLGKALNDPVKGISALSRSGVTFSEQQKATIKQLVAQNDVLGAQKIILKEVESQVGGAAAATATLGEKSEVAWGNIKEGFGTALIPLVDDMQTAFLEKGVPAAEKFVGWFEQKGVPALREFGDVAGPLAKSTLPAIGTSLGIVADGAKAVAPAVKSIVDSFNSLSPEAQKAILLGAGVVAVANKVPAVIPFSTKDKDTKQPDPKNKPKGGGGTNFLGSPALLGLAVGGMDVLDQTDSFTRMLKGNDDALRNFQSSFDKNGRATAKSIATVKKQFEQGNIGKYASDLGIDLDKLAESFANSGSEGEYVQKTMQGLEGRYSAVKDLFTDVSPFGTTESDKIAAFRQQLEQLGPEYDKAGDSAYRNGNQTRDLTGLMLGGDSAARKLLESFGLLGTKEAKPKISTPGMGAAIGSAGTLISQLNIIAGKDVTAQVRINQTGANLGGILGQLDAIKRKGSSGGGRVRGPGYSGGGWTGPGDRLDVAGTVHADEFVTKKTSRQSIERQAPGALDYMNQTGQLVTAGGGGIDYELLGHTIVAALRQSPTRVSISGRDFADLVSDANHMNGRLRG